MTNGSPSSSPDEEGDFTKEAASPDAASAGLSPIPTKPYDPEPEREGIRGSLAILLISLLIGVVAVSFFCLWLMPEKFENLKGLLELVFGPIIALVGAVTGFYFGGKTK